MAFDYEFYKLYWGLIILNKNWYEYIQIIIIESLVDAIYFGITRFHTFWSILPILFWP